MVLTGRSSYRIRALRAFRDSSGLEVSDVVAHVQTVDGLGLCRAGARRGPEFGSMVFVMLGNSIDECTHKGPVRRMSAAPVPATL